MRLGGERVCLVIPVGTPLGVLSDWVGDPNRSVRKGDDAVDGMVIYGQRGCVYTFCGEYALFDLQGDDDLIPTCMACVANEGRLRCPT
jgi:hypothetical protein